MAVIYLTILKGKSAAYKALLRALGTAPLDEMQAADHVMEELWAHGFKIVPREEK